MNLRILPALLCLLFFCFSCKKNGTGGQATIKATIMHHEKIIPEAMVYVKYNARELPGTNPSDYDESYKADALGQVNIEHLRYGEYYLYAIGYDNTIAAVVQGGVPLSIKWKNRKNTINLTVPVTE